jgi:hypothetical protein
MVPPQGRLKRHGLQRRVSALAGTERPLVGALPGGVCPRFEQKRHRTVLPLASVWQISTSSSIGARGRQERPYARWAGSQTKQNCALRTEPAADVTFTDLDALFSSDWSSPASTLDTFGSRRREVHASSYYGSTLRRHLLEPARVSRQACPNTRQVERGFTDQGPNGGAIGPRDEGQVGQVQRATA